MLKLMQICAIGSVAFAMSACSLNPFADKPNTDYRTSARGPALDVPPDLTKPRIDDRYRAAGVAGVAGGAPVVLPKIDNARIERSGNERWIVVNQSVETVYPTVRAFFQESNLPLVIDQPEIGVLETDWQETRANLGQDPVRSLLGRIASVVTASGTRDKYRVRIERAGANGTEIYLSHRAMEETGVGGVRQGQPERFVWAPKAADPNLEAEMLNRLLVRLGLPPAQALQVASAATASAVRTTNTATAAPAAAPLPARARMANNALEMDDPFDRAWRRVGLALDRVGFTVVDRDRTQGTYFVRYADETGAARPAQGGVMERLKFWKTDEAPTAEQYRVLLKETAGKTAVVVQDKTGAASPKALSDRILGLLVDQLK